MGNLALTRAREIKICEEEGSDAESPGRFIRLISTPRYYRASSIERARYQRKLCSPRVFLSHPLFLPGDQKRDSWEDDGNDEVCVVV